MKTVSDIKTWSLSTLVLLLFATCNALAHTDNETTLFPDLKSTDARFDVILLVSIGIIPVTKNFHPENRLTRIDLAAWGTLAGGLAESGDTPDIQALAETALKNGLIDSIDGYANYADIDKVLFNGRLLPNSPESIPSRADAATYVAAHLSVGASGETLLDRKAMYFGPTGEVTKVESRMNPDGGTSYFVTIDKETHPVYTHGKVANGPTDLKQWQERVVRRSIVRDLGQFKLWIYMEAEDESHADHQHSR